jgi:nicotinamide-nucleotide amidase
MTIAVAESCTGGLLANKLTNIPGSSGYFERGVVAYSNQSKMELLGVPAETLEKFGAVSAETAVAMAEGIRKISGADFGVSTTGIAGPTGGSAEKPVGLVYIGFAKQGGSYSKKFLFINDRITNKERTVQAALNLLRKELTHSKAVS